MDELLDLGVDGLITDRTDVLKRRAHQARTMEGPPMSTQAPIGIADLVPRRPAPAAEGLELVRLGQLGVLHDRALVLFAPYMITVAGRAAGCADPDETCNKTVSLLGLHLAAGSLPSYLISFATIASAFVLPIVGAFVDRSARKKWHMAALRVRRRRSSRPCCSS